MQNINIFVFVNDQLMLMYMFWYVIMVYVRLWLADAQRHPWNNIDPLLCIEILIY